MSNLGSFKRTVTNKAELPFQSELIDSVKALGGYGRKVSHPQLKGISDLLLAMPGYSLAQVECKDLGELKAGFDVQSGITEHQKNHVEALNRAAGGLVAFYAFKVTVGVTENCIFLNEYKPRFAYADMWRPNSSRLCGKTWPYLKEVWAHLGVSKIAVQPRNDAGPG